MQIEQKKKILIVDRDESTINKLSNLLTNNDFEVIASSESISAINNAKKRKVDLIILNMHLPQKDSQTFIKSLQAEAIHKKIPIVAVMEEPSYELVNNFLQYQPNVRESFVKPLNSRLLLDTINNLLGTTGYIESETISRTQKRNIEEFHALNPPSYDKTRKHVRSDTSIKTEILNSYTKGFICTSRIIDFSYGGVAVVTDYSLDVNGDITLRFIISNREILIPGSIKYKNTYRYDKNKKTFKYGIEYIIPNPEQKKLFESILNKLTNKIVN
jgi:DNA-binding response OmpR family regulator